MKRAPYAGTQAVLRAVRLLKAFSDAHPERPLPELVRLLGLNKTTVYRLLSALESEGMVERAGEAGWRLGPGLVALAARARGATSLRQAARPELVALARQTRETATLEVLSGREVVILDEARGGHMIGSRPEVGTRWAAHATSTGKVLLAHLTPRERAGLLPARLPAATPRTVTEAAALEGELLRARERGWALTDGELETGFTALGAPVRGADGTVVGAISVGGPRARFGPRRRTALTRALRAAAERISQRLGAPPQERAGRSEPDRRS